MTICLLVVEMRISFPLYARTRKTHHLVLLNQSNENHSQVSVICACMRASARAHPRDRVHACVRLSVCDHDYLLLLTLREKHLLLVVEASCTSLRALQKIYTTSHRQAQEDTRRYKKVQEASRRHRKAQEPEGTRGQKKAQQAAIMHKNALEVTRRHQKPQQVTMSTIFCLFSCQQSAPWKLRAYALESCKESCEY